MTFQDWVRDSGYRFKTQPPATAAKRSALAFVRSAFRRVEPDIIPSVWSREWDVLVILDACRVDQMQAVADEYDCVGEVNSVWSQASCSIDWIRKTFRGHPERAAECAYITANPFADHDTADAPSADLRELPMAQFEPLYEYEWAEVPAPPASPRGAIATVPPEVVTEYAIDAWRRRRETGAKRMIVHYMQPHEPYITHPEWGSGDHELLEDLVYGDADMVGQSVWQAIRDGETDVTVAELWQAGVENLRWVMDDIQQRLVTNCDAEIVLSADHGNAMGEWGEWHHPPGAIAPSVRKVPWVRVAGRDDETVQPSLAREDSRDVATDAQLAALGYRDE